MFLAVRNFHNPSSVASMKKVLAYTSLKFTYINSIIIPFVKHPSQQRASYPISDVSYQ